jgi:hypothetical protein
MPRYILTVATSPLPGREDEFNRWYDEVHLAEVLAVPGFGSAARFVADGEPAGTAPRYLAIYDIDSDDIDATMHAFQQFSAGLDPEPSLDPGSVVIQLYRSVGPPRDRSAQRSKR